MVAIYNKDYFEEFKPTPMMSKERFKLFFKRKHELIRTIYKDEWCETTRYITYKILNHKHFVLDNRCYTSINLPDIIIEWLINKKEK